MTSISLMKHWESVMVSWNMHIEKHAQVEKEEYRKTAESKCLPSFAIETRKPHDINIFLLTD